MLALSIFRLIRSFLLVLFIAVVEFRRGSFTLSGAITGFLLCFVVAYANIVFLFVMITFVLSGSFATRYKFDWKQSKILEDDHPVQRTKKKAARDWIQVLSNGGIACLYALAYCYTTNFSGQSVPIGVTEESSIYSIGFLSTIACCCADTLGKTSFVRSLVTRHVGRLASELGAVLARENPRLFTNPFRSVPTGTNGGVSLPGCLVSLLGGTIVACSYILGNLIFCSSTHLINTQTIHFQILLFCTLFGFICSLIDSLLGATLQFSGYDRDRKLVVQRPGISIERISGVDILSNNQVNLLSSLLTSLLAIRILPRVIF